MDGGCHSPGPGVCLPGTRFAGEGGGDLAEVKLECPVGCPCEVERPLGVGGWTPRTVRAGLVVEWHLGVTGREGVQEVGPGPGQH